MIKKLEVQKAGHSDEFGTPPSIVQLLIPHINPKWIIWEGAYGNGELSATLKEYGFIVVGDATIDFLTDLIECDCIITNPPYSIKDKFIARCYEINKPFALLLPLTALEGKRRGKLFREHGIQLIIPNKRVNFRTPSGKGSGAWFQVAWFCWKLNLPNQLNFVESTA